MHIILKSHKDIGFPMILSAGTWLGVAVEVLLFMGFIFAAPLASIFETAVFDSNYWWGIVCAPVVVLTAEEI